MSNDERSIVDAPARVVDPFEAEALVREGSGEVDPFAVPLDPASPIDGPRFEVRVVLDDRPPPRERARRGTMVMRRTVQSKGFVGPLLVEHATKLVEQLLLAGIVLRRIDDGTLEQGLVEPLVPGVVLEMMGAVVDRLNAVLHQPHADRREPSLARGA